MPSTPDQEWTAGATMPDEETRASTRSDLSGSAGDVVQARDVSGGVHFHGGTHSQTRTPRELPRDVHGFVNRVADIERLDEILRDDGTDGAAAVCVIAGTAGVGKTSLAVRWAHRAGGRFPDGQLYIDLRGYDPGEPVQPGHALERFLSVLGVEAGSMPVEVEARAALYRSILAGRRMLIVLDNAATPAQVRPLLPGSGRCLVVITSRSRLSALVARDGAHRVTLDVLSETESVELLQATTSGYRRQDDGAELAELARLCARLPLALRIAAERAAARPQMPLSELVQDLRDESSLWDVLSSDDDDEVDAVRTVFAWSYRALPEDAARLFRLLGMHPGPDFSVHAAAALAAVPTGRVRHLLDVLVGAHLLGQTGAGRYQFHDLLRAYATDQAHALEPEDHRLAAVARVLAWYLATAQEVITTENELEWERIDLAPPPPGVEPARFTNPDTAGAWFTAERANLVGAVQAAVKVGLDGFAWQTAVVLRPVYARLTLLDDWLTTSALGLDAARRSNALLGRALLSDSLGMASRRLHRLPEAAAHHREALEAYHVLGDRSGEIAALNLLGLVHLFDHRLDEARESFESVVASSTAADGLARVNYISNLAITLRELGRVDEALIRAAEAVALCRDTDQSVLRSSTFCELAAAHREAGDLDQAEEFATSALASAQDVGAQALEGYAAIELGRIRLARGRPEDALEPLHRAAVVHRRLGDVNREAETLSVTGSVYRSLGRLDEAVGFHRRAVAGHTAVHDQWRTALALHHLATALRERGDIGEAALHDREALSLVSDFDDPRAVELRTLVATALPGGRDGARPESGES